MIGLAWRASRAFWEFSLVFYLHFVHSLYSSTYNIETSSCIRRGCKSDRSAQGTFYTNRPIAIAHEWNPIFIRLGRHSTRYFGRASDA
jgi:hypothetical protein